MPMIENSLTIIILNLGFLKIDDEVFIRMCCVL